VLSVEDRLSRIEERLDKIEKLLADHCYGGVPSDHRTMIDKLDEVLAWMLRRRKKWEPEKKKPPIRERLKKVLKLRI